MPQNDPRTAPDGTDTRSGPDPATPHPAPGGVGTATDGVKNPPGRNPPAANPVTAPGTTAPAPAPDVKKTPTDGKGGDALSTPGPHNTVIEQAPPGSTSTTVPQQVPKQGGSTTPVKS